MDSATPLSQTTGVATLFRYPPNDIHEGGYVSPLLVEQVAAQWERNTPAEIPVVLPKIHTQPTMKHVTKRLQGIKKRGRKNSNARVWYYLLYYVRNKRLPDGILNLSEATVKYYQNHPKLELAIQAIEAEKKGEFFNHAKAIQNTKTRNNRSEKN